MKLPKVFWPITVIAFLAVVVCVAVILRDLGAELRRAAYYGDEARVKYLLEKYPGIVDAQESLSNTRTSFHFAAPVAHFFAETLHLKSRSSDSLASQFVDMCEKGGTPLILAAYRGHTNVVTQLLSHGAKVDARDRIARTALFMAESRWTGEKSDEEKRRREAARAEAAKLLLKAGADINVHAFAGNTPLHLAAQHMSSNSVEFLFKNGAVISLSDDKSTPLHLAAAAGSVESIEALLAHGAEINVTNKNGETPLALAVSLKRTNAVQVLRDRGAR